VGRTADYILRDEPNLIKFFIHAPYKYRIRFLCKERGITADEADDLIVKNDRERSRFYDFFTDKTWGQADSYDLSIDVTKLGGEENTAQFLADYVRRRMDRFE
jgi:cytidylate kinase